MATTGGAGGAGGTGGRGWGTFAFTFMGGAPSGGGKFS